MKRSRLLRGGVVGYGFISSEGHIPAYLKRAQSQDDVQIVALADICQARRALAQEALPHARIYSNYIELIRAEASQLDFIDIATPPCDHAIIARAALECGLHVLCEKPLTTKLEDAQDLLRLARTARRVIFPCHNYKHAPVVRAVGDIVSSGKIGRVHSVTLNTFRNTHAKGVTEWNTHWRRERKYGGGGIAMDHGSHTFYLAFEWMKEYPEAVTAKMSKLRNSSYPFPCDTEDNFSAVLTFPNGLVHAHLSWTAGVRKVIYTLQGERGAVTVDDDHLQLSMIRAKGGPDVAQGPVEWETETRQIASEWMDASHVGWFNSLFDQFKLAILHGDYVGKEAVEACLCIQLIMASYRSAQENCREISLEPLSYTENEMKKVSQWGLGA